VILARIIKEHRERKRGEDRERIRRRLGKDKRNPETSSGLKV